MKPLNVLFIAVDDLRPALGCYSDAIAHSPHIDRLAAEGTVFEHAYCQQAVCNPSRASVMTGMRPDTLRVWDLKSHFRSELVSEQATLPQFTIGTHFRRAHPEIITLPQYFKRHGYHAQSVGKIFHGSPEMQDPQSWSTLARYNVVMKRDDYLLPENQADPVDWWPGPKQAATEAADVPDNAYGDGKVADVAIEIIQELVAQPFFLAVGFRKPHLPFSAPKKYWDQYDVELISGPQHPEKPSGIPDYAWHNSRELRGYKGIPAEGPLAADLIQHLRHGYYACVSYMDAQVGRLLSALDDYDLRDNTVVMLWGDHGYHLGEKALWCKTTNYELDTRAPLIVRVPGKSSSRTAALVEFVDMYPTLIELCNLPNRDDLEGVSFAPLLDDRQESWKQAAFSQFPRPWTYQDQPEVMGYTIRTEHYRYTAWMRFRDRQILAQELYDHARDNAEIYNVADESAYQQILKDHQQLLQAGWQAALPPHMLNDT